MLGQNQKGGDGSVNVQISGDVVNGISYSEARQISFDVFRAESAGLFAAAQEEIVNRAEHMFQRLWEKMRLQSKESFQQFKDPAFLDSVASAQKAHCKANDADLENILINLVAQRSEQRERSLRQIALSDAIAAADKLPVKYIKLLAAIARINITLNQSSSLGELLTWYAESVPDDQFLYCGVDAYVHMESIGVIRIDYVTPIPLEDRVHRAYPGFFLKNINDNVLDDLILADPNVGKLIVQSEVQPGRRRFGPRNSEELIRRGRALGLSNEILRSISNIYISHLGGAQSIRSECSVVNAKSVAAFNLFDKAGTACRTRITPVGYALAYAELSRVGVDIPFDTLVSA
ncbi:LPO_1073/Vpar_1526 family protein [Burkholderia cepacia]|uniref:LPO_1073/Vpar_1526 family protein n=1 Tax=Burkholderia cepacia TaxID=292 RepID=UPI0012D86F85|nr:LPO_1073/Vpar_1526 family protein [Burkholderia cepacia]